ncbi:MAG: SulP family inorganic anion transporter [Alphaproteobacteria bacterium]|nr:SulP family inorganic anion transporter [Alphaproteobacteria bacterium]
MNLDVLSGLTVSLALVPEAIAFAFVAGVAPLVGLYAAFIVGLITAIFGGRPGMISGATGALAVVMVALVAQHGVQYLFATVILMGLLQLFAGVMRWGKFIRMVPHPVMLGFVNGLAIVIGLAQIDQFKITDASGQRDWLAGEALILTGGLVAATMILIWVTPRLTRLVPAPLLAIGVVTAVVLGFDLDVQRVGDLASLSGGLPSFAIPVVPMTLETLIIIFPYALILSAIGLIESLLTLNLVGELTNRRGGASQECLAQGAANLCTGFFGGMGGCAMIGQSMINVKSGGVGVIMSALVYAWNAAKRIDASTRPSVREAGALVYDIQGPLFFGSVTSFHELFDIKNDPDRVIIDFAASRIVDQSALQAIEDVAAKYAAAGKTLFLRHLSRDCHRLLSKSGQLIIDSDDDPDYGIAVDYGVKLGILEAKH